MEEQIKTKSEALTLALALAIAAPDQARADECIAMAEQIASAMTADQINKCKKAAQTMAGDLI